MKLEKHRVDVHFELTDCRCSKCKKYFEGNVLRNNIVYSYILRKYRIILYFSSSSDYYIFILTVTLIFLAILICLLIFNIVQPSFVKFIKITIKIILLFLSRNLTHFQIIITTKNIWNGCMLCVFDIVYNTPSDCDPYYHCYCYISDILIVILYLDWY